MTHTGNQMIKITDGGINVNIAESSDFKDHSKGNGQYTYNTNGAMNKDTHKGISDIQYNSLNLPHRIDINAPAAEAKTEYLYSATGTKLQISRQWSQARAEQPLIGSAAQAIIGKPITDTPVNLNKKSITDYVGNKVYEDGQLKRILIDGGYIENSAYHYFVTDHLGNNRVVSDQNGTIIQQNHYYPFGMSFADNIGGEKQPYKYNGKEEDTRHGLNLYDYLARQYDGTVPRFTSIDPHAENYYSWSPYTYVGNNPIKRIDPNGMDWVHRVVDGVNEIYYDRSVRSQDDVNNKYGENGGITHLSSGMSMTTYNKAGEITSQYTFFNDASKHNENGVVVNQNGDLMADDKIIYGGNYTIFGTSDNSVNAETLHKNLWGLFGANSYTGGDHNPQTYGNPDLGVRSVDSYQYRPRNCSEYGSMVHDFLYDKDGASAVTDAFLNTKVRAADRFLFQYNIANTIAPGTPMKDRARSASTAALFYHIYSFKSVKALFGK